MGIPANSIATPTHPTLFSRGWKYDHLDGQGSLETLMTRHTAPDWFLVSVVIPTRGNTDLVLSAVRSAIGQTLPPGEVIVSFDGPADPARAAAVRAAGARVIQSDHPGGGNAARMNGVRTAQFEWVAFLDDDDEWMPTKLSRQSELASTHLIAPRRSLVLTTGVRVVAPERDYIWPRTSPAETGRIADYLFSRRDIRPGTALLSASTIVCRRDDALAVPWKSDVSIHQDYTWLLDMEQTRRPLWLHVNEPLATYLVEQHGGMGSSARAESSLEWILHQKVRLRRREVGDFILCIVSGVARRTNSRLNAKHLARLALQNGLPGPFAWIVFASHWLISPNLRKRFRALVA
jgi:glycosyltransferase involved in cell wall biosynthesis